MKNNYIIMSDNTYDIPNEIIKENNICVTPLYYEICYDVFGKEKEMDIAEFYNLMREDNPTKTMAANPADIYEKMKKNIDEGKDILYISLSSGISSSYNNSELAKAMIIEEYPNANITIIDSLCASGGMGMLLYRAISLRNKGLSIKENYDSLMEYKHNIVHKFTVEDLKYLQRGGRISKGTAVIGSMINIKPILHVDEEGKLTAFSKARGRKKSIISIIDSMDESIGSWNSKDEENIVIISHADCLEDAKFAASLIKDKYNKKVIIGDISPTIGAHSGPGTLAIFFMGDKR